MNITLCDKLNDDIMHRLLKDLSCQQLVGLNGCQSRPQRVPKIETPSQFQAGDTQTIRMNLLVETQPLDPPSARLLLHV